MFVNWPSGNPSCWLGPMWGVVKYMCFRSLLNYGYENEAKSLAETMNTKYIKKRYGVMSYRVF